jgi:S1-C subfamily serine protease
VLGAALAARDPLDRSGLWLSLGDGGFKIMSVVKGSPADEAGIRVDDIVTVVDGVNAANALLVDLRERLKTAEPGTRIQLRLKTTMGTRDVTLTLRDLI